MKIIGYCRKCGNPVFGKSGHAGAKAVAGGLILGPVGAIAGAAHGLSKGQASPELCGPCRTKMMIAEMREERERSFRELEEEEIPEELLSKLEEDPIKVLKLRYAKGEITKE